MEEWRKEPREELKNYRKEELVEKMEKGWSNGLECRKAKEGEVE